MLINVALLVLAIASQGFALPAARGGGQTNTVEGVYTEQQAKRGLQVFDQTCSRCHMKDLSGSADVPSLAGEKFLVFWTDSTLWMLADRIQKNMPDDKPGSLTLAASVDAVAFILSRNGYPAGAAELAPNRAALEKIVIGKK